MTLYLLPNLLHENADPKASLVPAIADIIYDLDGFYVETPKIARVFLKNFDFDRLRDKPMEIIGKRGADEEDLLAPLERGESWGIISDAGQPCIADPGSQVVSLARRLGQKVVSFPGPCSVVHALSVSGLDGNKFTFHGYVPKKFDDAFLKEKGIHIFIETPYNNNATIKKLLGVIKPRDILCVACDLMSDSEQVVSMKASEWELETVNFHKRPAILLVQVR